MLHGQTRYNVRSRFFDELPEGALKWLTPQFANRSAGFGSNYGQSKTYGQYSSAWDDAPSVSEAAPAWSNVKRSASSGFRIGQSVKHAKFGEGVIISLEGSGSDARARINFGRSGIKELALGIAKLEPA